MKSLCGVFALSLLLSWVGGCRPPPTKQPPLPRPMLTLGSSTFKIRGRQVRVTVSPSGRSLAIVGDVEVKIVDLASGEVVRRLPLVKTIWPRKVLFLEEERSLLIIDDLFTAAIYPLDEREPFLLEAKVLDAEATPDGKEAIFHLYGGAYHIRTEDLFRKRQPRWQRVGDFAAFLPSGQIVSSEDNDLRLGKTLLLSFPYTINAIWPDPGGRILLVISQPLPGGGPEHPRPQLTSVDLKTRKASPLDLPDDLSPDQLCILRGSVRFSAAVANFLPQSPCQKNQAGPLQLLHFKDHTLNAILLDQEMPLEDIALSPDGRVLYVASSHFVWRFDANSGELLDTEDPGHLTRISRIAFSSDGSRLLSSGDGRAILWDVSTGKALRSFEVEDLPIFDAVLGEDILLAATPGDVRALDLDTGQTQWVYPTSLTPSRLELTSQNTLTVWLGEWKQETISLSLKQGGLLFHHRAQEHTIARKALDSLLSPEDEKLLALSPDQEVFIAQDGKKKPTSFFGRARQLAWLLGGRLAAVVEEGGEVYVYDGTSGALLGVTGPQRCGIGCTLAASPRSRHLAVGSADGVRLWDVKTRQIVWSYLEAGAGAPAFSPDGKLLAIARANGEIVLFQAP